MKTVRLLLLLALSSSFFQSCNNDDQPEITEIYCGLPPDRLIEELDWLDAKYDEIKDQPEFNGILLYEYDEMAVIEIQKAIISSINGSQYRCDGSKIIFNTQETADEFQDYRENRREVAVLFGTNIWSF